jgi:hypothetical protein
MYAPAWYQVVASTFLTFSAKAWTRISGLHPVNGYLWRTRNGRILLTLQDARLSSGRVWTVNRCSSA